MVIIATIYGSLTPCRNHRFQVAKTACAKALGQEQLDAFEGQPQMDLRPLWLEQREWGSVARA